MKASLVHKVEISAACGSIFKEEVPTSAQTMHFDKIWSETVVGGRVMCARVRPNKRGQKCIRIVQSTNVHTNLNTIHDHGIEFQTLKHLVRPKWNITRTLFLSLCLPHSRCINPGWIYQFNFIICSQSIGIPRNAKLIAYLRRWNYLRFTSIASQSVCNLHFAFSETIRRTRNESAQRWDHIHTCNNSERDSERARVSILKQNCLRYFMLLGFHIRCLAFERFQFSLSLSLSRVYCMYACG